LPIFFHILLWLRQGLSGRPVGKGRIMAVQNHNGQVLGMILFIFCDGTTGPPGIVMLSRLFMFEQITGALRKQRRKKPPFLRGGCLKPKTAG